MPQARVIVVGNEKGGAGKSTVAIHLAVVLMHTGARVVIVDQDERQRSTAEFFVNRAAWAASEGLKLPQPLASEVGEDVALIAKLLRRSVDFIIVDTPGADTPLSRRAHQAADLIITPMNDSFVDFGVLGVIDPVSLDLLRPSVYAETVWQARKARAVEGEGSIDWIILRNRLASVEARNRRRVDERLQSLAKRIGFRAIGGLRDRVIYRELYPFGLTVTDLSATVRPVQVSLTHIAARQELRVLMHELGLVEMKTGKSVAA